MTRDLDGMIGRLRGQPVPERLNGLEADLARRLYRPRAAATPAWRSAAVGLALAAGLGVGGSAAAWNGGRGGSQDLLGGARLAPSALLTGPE